ncbi:MAG: hypothetical protein NUV80_07505, partial [Candidatus Berkelbacteria bacterium]|nr:hypothetical protein [Candidatus Berkelbacteria bacterium]
GTSNQDVMMPVVSTLVLGRSFIIINNSTGNIILNSSGGNQIVILSTNTRIEITCVLVTGTTDASWDIGNYLAKDINAASAASLADADKLGWYQTSTGLLKNITWANIKAALATYFAIPATTAANDMQVGDGAGAWIKKTLAEFVAIFRAGEGNKLGYCHVHRNASNQTGATGGAVNKILFTTETADDSSWFDNGANSRYTPQVAGMYMVILSVRAANNGDSMQPQIYKNGSSETTGAYMSSGAGTGQQYSQLIGVVSMNGSTDYIEGWVYLPATITTINGEIAGTYMKIFKM